MARRFLRSSEVLQAVLASDSDSESDFGSGNSDADNVHDDRASQDADAAADCDVDDSEEMDAADDAVWVCPTFNWLPAAGDMPVMHPFTGATGINVDVAGFSPVQFFQLFISPELIFHFVVQTNVFASQFIQSHPHLGPHSRVHKWIDTNEQEMKKFLGLIFLMGIIHKPTVEMYWSCDILYATPLFSAIMPRNRFELLLKFFHVNDNTNEPDRHDPSRDRLFKLRPLIDHLFEHFQLVYGSFHSKGKECGPTHISNKISRLFCHALLFVKGPPNILNTTSQIPWIFLLSKLPKPVYLSDCHYHNLSQFTLFVIRYAVLQDLTHLHNFKYTGTVIDLSAYYREETTNA